jgi:murein DD-endopeptidase MepM/ murein hydrolase activator NlpD
MRALASLLLFLSSYADPQPVTYQRPVDAPISDPFRAPATPYGPGNRGIEFDTAPGATVRAAAAGEVTFAGPVAGRRYVTVLHADGVRTAYGPLGRVAVGRGDAVTGGEAVGTTTGPLLWTARIGDVYVDPAVLLAASGDREVRLVAGPGVRTAAAGRGAVPTCAALWALATPCRGGPRAQ